jgi:hypothetical protein
MDVKEIKEMEELKIEYNKEKYEDLARDYRPDKIKYLLIAESPPYGLTKDRKIRYFYNKEVTENDNFLINTIKGIYSLEKYTGSYKEKCLKRLQRDCFFLIDAVEYPINQFKEKRRTIHVKHNISDLLERIDKLKEKGCIDKNTKIILIKRNVFEVLEEKLKKKDFNVLNKELLPFPRWKKNINNFKAGLHKLLANDGFFEL